MRELSFDELKLVNGASLSVYGVGYAAGYAVGTAISYMSSWSYHTSNAWANGEIRG